MGKNASFKGDVSGTIENQVNDWDDQTIGGTKTFANTINSSADVMLSGSGKVSASFFFGDGTGLTNVGGTITSYTNHSTNRLIAGGASSTEIKGISELSYAASKFSVTGELSASTNISASQFYGDGANITGIDAGNVTAGTLADARIPNLNASKITAGTFTDARIPDLDTAKITTGTFANARISEASVTQYQGDLEIQGSQLAGTINNDRLPGTIAVGEVSASTAISGAFFEGDGGGLINVTAGPAGANTQVQFNDGGTTAGNSAFTFGKTTGVMTVTTGSFSKISSSLVPDTDNHFTLGASDLSSRWANVASVDGNFIGLVVSATGAVTHRLGVGTLSPQNELEVTGTAVVIGDLSASVNVSASAFYGSGANLTDTINSIDNYTANRMLVAGGDASNIDAVSQVTFNNPNFVVDGNISASSDVLVGGHISGSGNIILANNNNNKILWDLSGTSDEGPYIHGVSSSSGVGHTKKLEIHGDNDLNLMADSIIRFKVPDGTATVTVDANALSSSVGISGSSLHFADSPSGVITSGGNTFLDNNGNIFVADITSQGNVSASVNISASAFYGDGSNLEGISASSFMYVRHPSFFIRNSSGTSLIPLNLVEGAKGAGVPEIFFTAPASGSVTRVSISKGLNSATGSSGGNDGAPQIGDTYVFYMYVNSINTTNGLGATIHCTSSAENMKEISYTFTGTTQTRNTVTLDLKNSKPVVTGSNSFDPGDQLVFGLFKNNGASDGRQSVVITLELNEDWSL